MNSLLNKPIEPMSGSAITLLVYSGVGGALPLMAHPHRYLAQGL